MSMKKETKEKNKREWVKNVAIIFLSIMLVLTFFSNTIMNYSLPQVATEYVQSDTITAKIKGTGTVVASDPFEVKATETRKVTSVKVKAGDMVQKEDILFELEDKESDELIAARDELAQVEKDFQTMIIDNAISVEELNKIKKGELTDISSAQSQLSKIQNEMDVINGTINNLNTTIKDLEHQQNMLAYVDTSKETKALEDAEKALTDAQNKKSATQNQLSLAEGEKISAEQAYTNWEICKSTYDKALEKKQTAESNCSLSPTPENEAAKNAAQAELDAAKTDLDNAGNGENLKIKKDTAVNNFNTAKTQDDEASAALAAAETAKKNAETALNNKKDSTAIEQQLAIKNAELTTATSNLEAKTKELSELQDSFKGEMEYYNQYQAIVDAKEKVAKLEQNAVGGTIVAPISGQISNVAIVAGESMSPDMTIVTIQPAGKEKTLTITVTNEQAGKVHVGAMAELSNSWYYQDVTMKLVQIKADPESKGTKKQLVFSVEGDVMDGQSLDISVGDKSTTYDLVVPNSAVREDKDGKYILTVETKSSPLGNRYIATRVNVEVIAADEKKTAIKGDVEGYAYVITTASKPIAEKDQVRFYE